MRLTRRIRSRSTRGHGVHEPPRGPARRLALAVVLGAAGALSPAARAGEQDFYLSVPGTGGIYRLDPAGQQLTLFASGFSVPFYGAWASDGDFYLPDRGLGVVFRISAQGGVAPLAAGGFLTSPVTVLEAPDGSLIVSDIFSNSLLRLGPAGQQTLVADGPGSGGLLSGPGGLAFGPEGTLYVANNISSTIAGVDVGSGASWLISDGGGLLSQPGGVAADGAGNLFVANYETSTIARVQVDGGAVEIFCDDPFLVHPNDVRLAHEGGLHVTQKTGALVHIDALGQLTVVAQGFGLGEWDGLARPSDTPPCSGRFLPYGTGTAGSGGHVPDLRAIFSPCPGAAVALELDALLGGTSGALAYGLQPASLPLKGGTLLVNIAPPGGLIPLVFPGAGPGGGGLLLPFTFPDDQAYSGLSFYLQVLALDPGATAGVSFSNGLQELIGS